MSHEVSLFSSPNLGYYPLQFLVCLLVLHSDLLLVCKVEHGSPYIRHLDAKRGIHRNVPLTQDLPRKVSHLSGCGTVGCNEVHIVACGDVYQLKEFLDQGRQTPEMGGTDDADVLSFLYGMGELFPFHAFVNVDDMFLKGSSNGSCNVPTVSCTRKIVYHNSSYLIQKEMQRYDFFLRLANRAAASMD